MNVLAIGNETKEINFAIFGGEILKECGKIEIVENLILHDSIYTTLKEHKIAFVVLQAIDFTKTKRSRALELVRVRTIIKLVCEKLGVVYTTPSTYGFDRFFFGDKIQEKKLEKEKLKITNDIFDLSNTNVDLANAIMLGWSFARNEYKVFKGEFYGL